MASPGREYALVGFSEEVDRRPLVFAEALPAGEVCNACERVAKVLGLLSCGHYFCNPCYMQCLRRGELVCPLGGEARLEEEVTWTIHSTRSVMEKKVLCWNHRFGCNVVTPAADISRHFHQECRHHSSRCPKRSAEIPASDVCTHLESRCDAARVPRSAAVEPVTVPQEQESFGATCSESADGFRQMHNAYSIALSLVQAKLKDQLDDFMQNVYANLETFHNSFVEKTDAFKQSLTDTVPSRMNHCELATQLAAFSEAMRKGQHETKAAFDRLELAIDRKYDEMSELLRSTDANPETRTRHSRDAAEAYSANLSEDASKIAWAKNRSPEDRQIALALLHSIMPVATTHTWTFEDYEPLKQRAQSEFSVARMGEPVYLRGYCVSVSVGVNKDQVYFYANLHQGQVDRFLEWPFNLQMRFSLLHTEESQKLEYCVTPSTLYKEHLLRPSAGSWRCLPIVTTDFSTKHLEARGFIKDGRLLLRFSLEDPSADDEP